MAKHNERNPTFSRCYLRVDWLRLFYVWQKTKDDRAFSLWSRPHDLPILYREYNVAQCHRSDSFNPALFSAFLK
jgi:hypothetical protein